MFSSHPIKICLLFLLTGLVSRNVYSWAQTGKDDSDLYQRAEFYLRELSTTLQRIKQSTQRTHKRSADQLDDKILTHLRAICSHLEQRSNDTLAESNEVVVDAETNETVVDEEGDDTKMTWSLEEDQWKTFGVYVTNVHAERVRNNVTLTFTLVHTGQAFITRLVSLDNYTALAGEPGNYSDAKTSNVTLSVDTSQCDYGIDRQKEASFHIGLVSQNVFTMEIAVDICTSDLEWKDNETIPDGNDFWERKKEQVVSKSFDIPKIQVLDDPGEELLMEPDKNVKLYVAVKLYGSSRFQAMVNLWDWDAGLNESLLEYAEYNEHNEYYPGESRLVNVTGLNETKTANSSVGETVAKLRIDLRTGEKNISGQLFLMFTLDHFGGPSSFIKSYVLKRTIWLKLPNKHLALPRNHVEIYVSSEYSCDQSYLSYHGSCIIECFVEGTDIESVFILKTDPYIPPIRSTSYVLHGSKAVAITDTGPPSKRNEGFYKCIVVTENGQITSQDTQLITYGFTKIDSVDAIDQRNGTLLFSCQASGYQPLQMSLRVTDGYNIVRKLDSNENADVVSSLNTVGNTTTLTMWVPTKDIGVSEGTVECQATGLRGDEIEAVNFATMSGN